MKQMQKLKLKQRQWKQKQRTAQNILSPTHISRFSIVDCLQN